MAVLVDSSTILALATIGELDLLKNLFGSIEISEGIQDEVLVREGPAKDAINEAIGDWIVVKTTPHNNKSLMCTGL
jgi:predicted nucleic acid-binding protein